MMLMLKPKVWSNAFFIIPFLLSFFQHLFLYSLLIFMVMFFSALYHLWDEKRFNIPDKVSAYLLISYNLYLLYLSNFRQPYSTLAFLFVFIAFYFFFVKKKDDWEWHIASSIITIFCIFAYSLYL